MMELKGKYGIAKVFTDVIEDEAIKQIITLLNQPFVDGCSVRIMPDVHAGAGCTVGFTANLGDKVIPNLVGVDTTPWIGQGFYPGGNFGGWGSGFGSGVVY